MAAKAALIALSVIMPRSLSPPVSIRAFACYRNSSCAGAGVDPVRAVYGRHLVPLNALVLNVGDYVNRFMGMTLTVLPSTVRLSG